MNSNNQTNRKSKSGFWASKFVEFCKRTDLHGYKYIVMEELSIVERCCWAIAVMLSIVLAAVSVATAYKWYSRNPIVTVIESTHGAIWDIPFPAVTVCDLNFISRKRARRFADTVQLPDTITADELYDGLKYLPLIQAPYYINGTQKDILYKIQEVLNFNHITISEIFELVGPSDCSDLIVRCLWKNTIHRCELLFDRIKLHHSLCCTFNYYGQNSTSPEGVFRPETPRRVASCGYQTGVTALLNIDPDDYYSAAISSYGVMVYIDNSYNYPNLQSPIRIVNPSTEAFIAITPERTYATSGVSRFAVNVRQCLFSHEMKVANFTKYTYHNCLAYQEIATILHTCGCAPYYFPLKDIKRSCDFSDIECLQYIYTHKEIPKNITNFECYPDCEHFDYPLEVAFAFLARQPHINDIALFKDINVRNHSLLNVFFNDLVSTRYRRDVYFNWQNLLASFGGLMSLMLGFTLISGFDLIIFFTFRVGYVAFTSVVKEPNEHIMVGKKKRSGRKNKINIGDSYRNTWVENSRNSRNKLSIDCTQPPRYEDTGRY